VSVPANLAVNVSMTHETWAFGSIPGVARD